jgi:arabinan endo-1,5-alpha-L-arabinosidase
VIVENQKLEEVAGDWPEKTPIRISDYMNRPHQKWSFVAVPEAGGYLGGPYFKIVIEGTDRALTATADCELESAPFEGTDAQLWRVDQLTDGTYRIMPKAVPGCDQPLCLVSVADSTPTLAKFNFNSDNCKWNLKHYKAL